MIKTVISGNVTIRDISTPHFKIFLGIENRNIHVVFRSKWYHNINQIRGRKFQAVEKRWVGAAG